MSKLNAKPEALYLDLKRTAIVIVDMQNAFASKGGMFDLNGLDIFGAAAAVSACKTVVDAARGAKMKVIHLRI